MEMYWGVAVEGAAGLVDRVYLCLHDTGQHASNLAFHCYEQLNLPPVYTSYRVPTYKQGAINRIINEEERER